MDDFRIKITSDLDLSKAESKINNFLNKYNGKDKIKLNVDIDFGNVNSFSSQIQNQIQKGFKNVKLDSDSFIRKHLDQIKKDVDEAVKITNKYQDTLSIIGNSEYNKNALSAVKARNKEEEKLNKQLIADSKKAMNQKIADINQSYKEQESLDRKNQSTRKKNAEIILNEELALIQKQAKNKADIIKNSFSGNTETVSVLKEERLKMKSEMKKLNADMKQYNDIFDSKTHSSILNSKRKESKSIIDIARAKILDQSKNESIKEAEKIADIQQKAFTEIRKDAYQSIGEKSSIQTDMSNYYRQLENDSIKGAKKVADVQKKINNSILDFNSLKSIVQDGGYDKYGGIGYEKLTSQINLAESALQRFNAEANKGDNANLDRLNSDMKEFISLTNKANKEQNKLSERASSQKQISELKDLERYWKSNTKAHKDNTALYESYKSQLSKGDLTTGQLQQIQANIKNWKKDIEIAGKSGRSFSEELSRGFKQIGQFATTYGLIQEVPQLIMRSVSELKEMDNTLTEISKTSDLTISQIKQLGKDSFENASKYGRTANDYLIGVQEMSRSGFYGKQAEELAELSILGQAAGDMNRDVSNSYLLATNAAYNYQGSVQKLNTVLDGQNMINIVVMLYRNI